MKSPRAQTALLMALAVVALVHASSAAVAFERVIENPMYPRHCKDRALNKYFPDGSSWLVPGQCMENVCSFPIISSSGCGSVGVEPPCTIVSDKTLPYPECCPQPRCPSLELSGGDFNEI